MKSAEFTGFLRSITTLASGTAISQGLVAAASPILTRLYSPEAFGALGVFASILTILGCVATLRYEMAIPLPDSDEDALTLCALSIAIALLVAAGLALPAILLSDDIGRWLKSPTLASVLWTLPLGVLGIGLYQSLYYWAVRHKRYGSIAATKVTQSAVMLAIQVCGHVVGTSALVFGHVLSRYAGIGSLLRGLPRFRLCKQYFYSDRILRQARRHRRFALWSAPGALVNAIGVQFPMLAFASFFSAQSAGLYALTHRVLSVPIAVIGSAVADVFFSDAADNQRSGTLGHAVILAFERLALLGTPPIAAVALIGPFAFSLIFGSAWTIAGEMAQLAAPWLLLTFLTSPLSRVYLVAERQRELFFMQLLQPCIGALAIALSVALQATFLDCFRLFSLAYSAFYFGYLVRCLSIGGASILRAGIAFARISVITLLTLVAPFLLINAHLSTSGRWGSIASIGLCGALTFFSYWALSVKWRPGLNPQ